MNPRRCLLAHDTERLFGIIRRLRAQKGCSCLHQPPTQRNISRLPIASPCLRDGKLIGIRPAAETNESELIRMMVGRALELEPLPHLDECRLPTGPVVLAGAESGAATSLARRFSIEVRAGEIVGLAGSGRLRALGAGAGRVWRRPRQNRGRLRLTVERSRFLGQKTRSRSALPMRRKTASAKAW